jgi:Xaa-Pro aminopeptidase
VSNGAFLPQLQTLLQGNIRQELAFSNTEYRSRVDRVTRAMKARKLDVLITGYNPNICYLTGFQYTNTDYSGFLLLRRDGYAGMVVAGTELATVLVHGWVRDVKEFASWDPPEAIPLVVQYVKDWGFSGGTIGMEQRFEVLDPRAFMGFKQLLPHATFLDASDIVVTCRAVKSDTELAHLQKAAYYSDMGMLAAFAAIHGAKTENDVAAAASEAMILSGSEYFSTAPLVGAGKRTGMPRAMWKRGRIGRDDPVTIELAGVFQRYSAPLARTVTTGQAPTKLVALAKTARDCLNALLDRVEVGRPISDVAKALRRKLRDLENEIAPLRSFGSSIGVGLAPTWNEDWMQITESNSRRFAKGMVFYSPIRLCFPGQFGVCLGESWVVTKLGARRLSNLPDL